MSERERFLDQIDALNPQNFEKHALFLFEYQYKHNPIYKKYVDLLGRDVRAISKLTNIPFLPIEFFKSQRVAAKNVSFNEQAVFESSGTTATGNSKHYVFDLNFYLQHSKQLFEADYGELSDYTILALLPSYLERNNSSLVAMVDYFIKETESEHSGFYLHDYQALIDKVVYLKEHQSNTKIIIWGVSFALLDLAEDYKPDFSECIVMETGGMKGRRAEITRAELHEILKQGLNVSEVHSEYGMTELLSQSYSQGVGIFHPSKSMKILTREVNDPFALTHSSQRAGGINVIDLANIDSCAFIETKDVGYVYPNGSFKVLGRFDHSDVRGCNLMVS
jgi:hypothetical protein